MRHGDADVAAALVEVRAHDAGDLVFEAVAGMRDRRLTVELEALEVLLQDEVGHAGDGVRAIGRRGTARDDLDALDGGRRDGVDVDDARGVARRGATAIEQHEVAVGTEAAQRHGGRAGGVGCRRLDVATRRWSASWPA